MKVLRGKVIAAVLVAGVLTGWSFAVEGEGDQQRPGKVFHKEQREKSRAHFKQQCEENKEFRKSTKDKSASEQCAALKDHLTAQYDEDAAFREEQYTRRIELMKERMAEKDCPAEKQSEVLERLGERHASRMAHFEQQHAQTMGLLENLCEKDDLTVEELHEELKAHMQARRAENKALREKHRSKRQKKRGKCRRRHQKEQPDEA